MKNHSKKMWMLAMVAAFLAAGCSKLKHETGKFVVRMTDAPAMYEEVNVDIKAVEVHYADSADATNGWVNLATNAGIYDLLKLQNNVSAVIATGTNLPVGKINKIRLILGSGNTIVVDSAELELKVPSGIETGIMIDMNADVVANANTAVTIDFDAFKSVVVLGKGNFNLKPGITVKSIAIL